MEKLNIAEILKDCPKGMELDCAMYENVEFDCIEQSPESKYPIHCLMKTNDGYNTMVFTNNGCNDRHPNAKCVIFPKGKTTWEGFQRPFKDGDVVSCTMPSEGTWIGIFKQYEETNFESHCSLNAVGIFRSTGFKNHSLTGIHLATEEEKQKLFDAIKANGYKWNPETKTLEKLIIPKFKVGDWVEFKYYERKPEKVIRIENNVYWLSSGKTIMFQDESAWDLTTKKFDITTLKPFESRVLVRTNNRKWVAAFYSHYDKDSLLHHCVVGGLWYEQCVPYNGNEHLLDTTNDCDDYYKTWE